VYNLADYLWMIADRARVGAYAGALRAQIAPGTRVLEIGAGFGFFSVIAVNAGAEHVDAIETNPIVHLGPKVAAANGCADRIRFHHHDASLVVLDQPADLLIADLRGPTPFGYRALDTIIAARQRLLRPGGAMIARRDTLFVAPTAAPAGVRQEIHAARGAEGINLDPVERIAGDTPMGSSIGVDDLLADGQPWLELDYGSVTATEFTGDAGCELRRHGRMEGLAVWFESDLGAGFAFSTAPGSDVGAYHQMFIPLRAPLEVAVADRLRIRLTVRHVRGSAVWEWHVWTIDRTSAEERLVTHQSSLTEMVVDPAAFVDTSEDARPVIGPRGRALHRVLGWMNGRDTVATLAMRLQRMAPELFPDLPSAADFVADCCHRSQRFERNAD
jgi:protein arginine N-methyltransferase 1